MTGPTPLLDSFKRGEVARDVKMVAAAGALATRAYEQLAILAVLVEDADAEVRTLAGETLSKIPAQALKTFLSRPDVPEALKEFFARRGMAGEDAQSAEASDADVDQPEITDEVELPAGETAQAAEERRLSISQKLAKMSFTQRLKAATKGNKEVRAILIRDPSKMIAVAVLNSPKVSDAEVASFARMTNVSEDVLRQIGNNRAWLKNYNVIAGLTRNPKTPVAMSMNLMNRLSDRDLAMLATDRNVPEPLRVAARKKVSAAQQK